MSASHAYVPSEKYLDTAQAESSSSGTENRISHSFSMFPSIYVYVCK